MPLAIVLRGPQDLLMTGANPRWRDDEKVGSNLGQLSAENQLRPRSMTQSQAKRINEIANPLLFRDQVFGHSLRCWPEQVQSSPWDSGQIAADEKSVVWRRTVRSAGGRAEKGSLFHPGPQQTYVVLGQGLR